MKVLVTGAAGQLGAVTVDHWRARGHDVAPFTRAELDITDSAAVRAAITRHAPDVVINCAADNRVDRAETAPSDALVVNTWAVRAMARAAAALGATFVHYSTDFVFDGVTDTPYTEEHAPNPQSAYATSKLLGEWFAAEASRHYVLRVESLFGGPVPRSSVDRILAQLRGGQAVTAFADRVVSPSHVGDVAQATRVLVEGGSAPGVYHCVNSGHTTWLDLALTLRDLLAAGEVEVRGVPAASLKLPARRPQYAALSNAKLAAAGVPMRPWQDALRDLVPRRV